MKDISFSLLMMISKKGKEGVTWKELECNTKISTATLSKYLKKLQSKHYLDKRIISINPIHIKYFITPEGTKHFVQEGKRMLKMMKKSQELLSRAVVKAANSK